MKTFIPVFLLFSLNLLLSQNGNLKDFDFLNHDYKYLDSDYNIQIDSITFNNTVVKYKFIRERIVDYDDSLSVALMSEFGNWKKSRMASLRILYKWARVGHHLWKKEAEIKKLGHEFKINRPYELQKLFYNPKENKKIALIIDTLRTNLIRKYKLDTLKTMSNRNLMTFAFNRNPDVLQLKRDIIHRKNIERFLKKHGRMPNDIEKEKLGLSCGKENCCQL